MHATRRSPAAQRQSTTAPTVHSGCNRCAPTPKEATVDLSHDAQPSRKRKRPSGGAHSKTS
eukprot:3546461-Alexandrium_andersonii.AAC.1